MNPFRNFIDAMLKGRELHPTTTVATGIYVSLRTEEQILSDVANITNTVGELSENSSVVCACPVSFALLGAGVSGYEIWQMQNSKVGNYRTPSHKARELFPETKKKAHLYFANNPLLSHTNDSSDDIITWVVNTRDISGWTFEEIVAKLEEAREGQVV